MMASWHEKRRVRLAFDRAAESYDAAAFLQQEVARRLDERLDLMKIAPHRVLDAGCGTGFALPLLRHRYPSADVLALDLAPAMLVHARRRLSSGGWLAGLGRRLGLAGGGAAPGLLCADLEQLPLAPASIDLVWSSLALQWMDDLEGTFRGLRQIMRPGGLILFSTFGPDTLKELRAAFQGLDGYAHVNRFLDMHDVGDMLGRAGFQHPVMEMEHITLTYVDLKALLRELKAIGAHTVREGGRMGLMGKEEWRRFQENYEKLRQDGRLPATYEVVYGHAWVGNAVSTSRPDGDVPIHFAPRRRHVVTPGG